MAAPKLNQGFYYNVMAEVDKLDETCKRDLISEMVSELVNPRWSNNDDRITGILEAMEFVLGMDIIN